MLPKRDADKLDCHEHGQRKSRAHIRVCAHREYYNALEKTILEHAYLHIFAYWHRVRIMPPSTSERCRLMRRPIKLQFRPSRHGHKPGKLSAISDPVAPDPQSSRAESSASQSGRSTPPPRSPSATCRTSDRAGRPTRRSEE